MKTYDVHRYGRFIAVNGFPTSWEFRAGAREHQFSLSHINILTLMGSLRWPRAVDGNPFAVYRGEDAKPSQAIGGIKKW